MSRTTDLNIPSIPSILDVLSAENRVEAFLPGGGFLHVDDKLPFLLIYRIIDKGKDLGTKRLVKSAGSYLIIGSEDFSFYRELLQCLADYFSAKYNSYLLFEIYSGTPSSNKFIIKGPAHKLPTTLEVLRNELSKIPDRLPGKPLQVVIKQTKSRQAKNVQPLLEIEDAKKRGALLLALKVPPVYRDAEGTLYPVFFRHFRDVFSEAIQKTVFDYLRVQTTSDINSYYALGKRKVHDKVFEIDRKLTEIETAYQFLLLVAPVNIQEIRDTFFDSGFKDLLPYHYRLLTVDPDLLKRQLFNLEIDQIDDPALSFIFKEKREELDQQITMLNERGSSNFFYNSVRLYHVVDASLKEEALQIVNNLKEEKPVAGEDIVDAQEFSAMARKEFAYFQEQEPQFKSIVHIREDVHILMVSRGELYIPADYTLNRTDAEALIQHEVSTHVLTYFNGKQQPLSQLSAGLANYDPLQEGIAVLAEYFSGGLSANRLRLLAGRVLAGAALLKGGDFQSIFDMLYNTHGFSKERAFNITSRIMQGGGFLKDIIYLKGLLELTNYLKDGGDFECLLAGKFALKHLTVIQDLTARDILKPPVLRPRYMESAIYENNLTKIREGITLSQLVNP